jgi:hypothetical protein
MASVEWAILPRRALRHKIIVRGVKDRVLKRAITLTGKIVTI